MRTTTIAMQLLVLLAVGTAGAQQTRQQDEDLRRIDALIPQMASDDVALRQESQKTFEMICLSSARPGAEPERAELCGQIVRRLGPETPMRARVWMIRQLERIGGDECVDALTKLLGDKDALIRETARRALQQNSSARVRPVLERALEQADTPERRIALINVLAARREADSAETLCRWAKQPQRDVAAAAIAALGDLGGDQAIETLYALWHEDDPAMQKQATAALLRIGEQLADAGERELAGQLFDDLYKYSGFEPISRGALRGLTLAKGPAAIVPLLRIMEEGDPQMQTYAARLAAEIPGEAVTLTLAMMMPNTPDSVQATLLEGLGKRGDATARSAAINATHSSDEQVRIAALGALQELGNSSDAMLLAHVAATTTGAERDAARAALGRLRGADVDETILKAAQDLPDAGMRCEMIRSLAARRCGQAIPTLLSAAQDPAEDIQVAAFEALGGLAGPEHLPALAGRLVEELSEAVREAAEDAVVDAAARIEDAEQRADAVLALFPDASGSVKASLIRVLGRLGGERALAAIRGEWRSEQPEVADAAVRALANWPTVEAAADLLEIARAAGNEAHLVLALRGYVRLVRLPGARPPAETFQMLEQAMSLATRPEEKKLVLGGLAEVRHIDALMLAETCLGDEPLRDEAGVAMLSIAQMLAGEQPDAAAAALEKVRRAATSERVKQQLAEVRELLERFAGYSASWLVAGPYMREGQDAEAVFDIVFPPETPGAANVEWKPLDVNNPRNPWIFELDRAIGGNKRCVYVRTAVWSDAEQAVQLAIGSDDAVKAWLNDELVHSNLVFRGVTPGEDKVKVTLRKGWNRLMLKVVQGSGGWGFCAGFVPAEGGKLEGLKFRAE